MQRQPEDQEQYESESLPGQFFYGIPDWENRKVSIDEAAKAAHPYRVAAHSVNLSNVVPDPKSTELDISSVVAIFDFIKESDLLEDDPLKSVVPWEGEPNRFSIYQGPANYIAHRRRYHVINGELKKREG